MKTWKNIRDEVINLGFTKEKEYTKNQAAFIEAANEAMRTVSQNARPILSRYIVNHYPLKNLLPSPLRMLDMAFYDGISPMEYSAGGAKSYYFECNGTGTATITDDDGQTVVGLNSAEFKAYRGFCNGETTITFSGAFGYCVKNIAIYGVLLGASVNDIPPFSQYVTYNIEELTRENGKTVFMDFALDHPVFVGDFSGGNSYRYVSDYEKEGRNKILLNSFEKGQFEIWFKRYPKIITAATPDDEAIELDDLAADIVPYLMANRLWLDDEPEKAIDYYNRAVMMMNEIATVNNQGATASYINTTGWY